MILDYAMYWLSDPKVGRGAGEDDLGGDGRGRCTHEDWRTDGDLEVPSWLRIDVYSAW